MTASMRPGRIAAALSAAAVAALLVPAGPAEAGLPVLYEVTTTADQNNGPTGGTSLREAIAQANADTVNDAVVALGSGLTYHLTLCDTSGNDENANTSGDLDHNDPEPLTILGDGSTITQDCNFERVLQKSSASGLLELSDVTIAEGYGTSEGGGVRVAGNLTLEGATIRDNVADQNGAAVHAGGLVSVTSSTITQNQTLGGGAGVWAGDDIVSFGSTWTFNNADNDGGAMHAEGDVVLTASTVTHNFSDDHGGGVDADGSVTINSSTLVANRATIGANVFVDNGLTRLYTVIALGSVGDDCNGFGTFTSLGYNVGDDESCGSGGTGDLPFVHPMLAPPALNGGLTANMRPVTGSPVLNLDPAPCGAAQSPVQNGASRPQGSGCESGSFEGSPPPCTPPAFSDVGTGHGFFSEICWLSRLGIAGGFPDGTYKPAQAVTRQSMAAFIYRLAGSPLFDAPGTPSFSDVPSDSTFFTEIEWMVEEEITGGFPGGVFKPGQAVSRQAMAAFLFRVAGSPFFPDPPTATFNDVPTTSQFFTEIEWLADSEVTGGFPDGGFHPSQAVARQAMAAFLQRMASGVVLEGL